MDSAAAAQAFLSNAGRLLGKEYQHLRGVGGQVAELRDELDAMNALLVMQSEADDGAGAVDLFLQVCMRQLREVAYDAEDCIDLYTLRIRSRRSDGVRAWLGRLLGTLASRRRLAGEIAALRARAVAIGERQARFGVNRDALRRRSSSPPLLPASPMLPAAAASSASHRLPVGIEDQANALAARLKAPAVGEEEEEEEAATRMAVFSIVGFGGLGKTTLAVEVCRRLEAEFPWQAMVSVSQAFEPSRDLKVLLKDLLQQVVKPKMADERGIKEEAALGAIDALDDNLLAKKLEDLLANKRYLIVIDDVWTMQAWEAIKSKLPENNKSSRIILTTRIETVANACSPDSISSRCKYIHKMQPLELEDSKKLFVSRVFGSVDASYPKEFEDVMGDILKKCGGLPLAIVSIASVLVEYKSLGSKDKWDRVCKSLGSQMESHPTLERMKHIVTVSYNDLPYELKGCMMYFSIFPEDYAIRKDRLLNRWIAEGLVHEKRGLSMWEVAESYLDKLLSKNMVEEGGHLEVLVWKQQQYRVHDILHEVMVSKSLEANFLSLHGGQHKVMSCGKIRRLSIHADVDDAKRNDVDYGGKEDYFDMQHVRSLSMFHLHGGHKLLKNLDSFVLLRVLDLEDCEGVTNKHVRYACNLYLLRFLSLRGTNVNKVPRQIENLEHLQMLDLDDTLLTELPETVTKLEKLEDIRFSNRDDRQGTMWTVPRGISKMKALRVLCKVTLGNDDSDAAQELGELEQLQVFVVSLDDYKTIVDEVVLRNLALSISKMCSLRWLLIGGHRRSDDDDGKQVLNFLHHLPVPPRLLQTLWIKGDVDGLPGWVSSLTHLVTFTIKNTTLVGDQLFSVLCKLPNLKGLYVTWTRYGERNDELVARCSHRFSVLRDLILGGCLPKVIRFEQGSMSMLENLDLRFDYRSTHVTAERSIVGIQWLTSLKKVTLDGSKDNPALIHAVELLKQADYSGRLSARSNNNEFQVAVKYR